MQSTDAETGLTFRVLFRNDLLVRLGDLVGGSSDLWELQISQRP